MAAVCNVGDVIAAKRLILQVGCLDEPLEGLQTSAAVLHPSSLKLARFIKFSPPGRSNFLTVVICIRICFVFRSPFWFLRVYSWAWHNRQYADCSIRGHSDYLRTYPTPE